MRSKPTKSRANYKTFLLAMIFFIPAMLPLTSVQAQNTWYDKARAATDNNRKVEFYTRALEEERQDSWVYYFRGWAHYGLGRYEKALRDFKSGEKAEGNLEISFLYSAMAWCHYQMDEYDKSLSFADKALEARENNAEAWNVRGWSMIQNEKPEEAVKSFSKYILNKPDHYLGYSYRSYAYSLTKEYAKVITDVDKALSLKGDDEYLLERKAYALIKMGKRDEGIALIKEKINYKPDDPRSLSNIGNLFYRNEDYHTAIEYHTLGMKLYDKKIKDDREYMAIYRDDIYDIYMSRGNAYYALKDYQHALGDYKKSTTIKPNDHRAWHEIGNLQTYQKNWSEGAKAYETAFRIKPDLKNGWVNLGFCYDNLNQPTRAIDAYTRGIEVNPKEGLLYNNRGYGYLELKQYEKAFADLQKAIDVEPGIVMSHVSLGEYYYDRKMYAESIAKMTEAMKMEDGTKEAYTAAHYTRGMCYFEQKNYKKAKADFMEAIAITKDHVLAHEKLGITYYHLEELCDAYKTLKLTLNLESTVADKQAMEAPRFLGKMTTNPCTK